MVVSKVFTECVTAIRRGELIAREGARDKEFHFQDWFKARLDALGEHYDESGRNSYPDFTFVRFTEGYELKGLAYPGRYLNFDCNSQVPCGTHNGREIFYVFGRYPSRPDGNRYPVLDLVICHGSFLNADSTYVHKNKSFKGFGSFGDIQVRDRKMYVAPTPFAILEGTAHRHTLILPAGMSTDPDLVEIDTLVRREVDKIVSAYRFDLGTSKLSTTLVDNPHAGRAHEFQIYRLAGDPTVPVTLRTP